MTMQSDFFMAVYGYRKTHAQLIAQGRDPTEVGRDQVMNIMRGLGIRGVRRGKTPVTTKPAKGTGGRPDLVDRRFEACAPNRLHVADITYVRMANGSFGYTAFADGVYARRIVGWACAMTMNTQEPPLQALEQAIAWAATHGSTDGLVHHSDHGRLLQRAQPPVDGRRAHRNCLFESGLVDAVEIAVRPERRDPLAEHGLHIWAARHAHQQPQPLQHALRVLAVRRFPAAPRPRFFPDLDRLREQTPSGGPAHAHGHEPVQDLALLSLRSLGVLRLEPVRQPLPRGHVQSAFHKASIPANRLGHAGLRAHHL